MSMANREQHQAIYHQGGVLLEAGAGSGKTFVIIEHVLYLLEEFVRNHQDILTQDLEQFEDKIRKHLSQMVLMTFTKKAAGELYIRLCAKLEEREKISKEETAEETIESEERRKNPWTIVRENLDHFLVSTIHGFCLRILRKGIYPGIYQNFEIVSEGHVKGYIRSLFDLWLAQELRPFQNPESLNEIREKKDILYSFLGHKEEIFESLCSIFNDPNLRMLWKEFDPHELQEKGGKFFFKELSSFGEFKELLTGRFPLSSFQEFKKLKWLQCIEDFESIKFLQEESEVQGNQAGKVITEAQRYKLYFEELIAFFQRWKRITKPNPDLQLSEAERYLENLKNLRSLLLDNQESLRAFFEKGEKNFSGWAYLFKRAFDSIEGRYLEKKVLTFADLEYYVALGLKNPKVLEDLAQQYQYFILDEFQDTSGIQYAIIQTLIQNEFQKLFCVGDIKQAIYGFRGGELGVFLDCKQKIPLTLSLKNNYRSLPSVIQFNNSFFSFLFSQANAADEGTPEERNEPVIPMMEQDLPEGLNFSERGEIVRIEIGLEQEDRSENLGKGRSERLSSARLNFLESKAILEHLKQERVLLPPEEKIAILYKSLSPSKILIALLLEDNWSFTAQVKIPYGEDPLVGIFQCLIEDLLDQKGEASKGSQEVHEGHESHESQEGEGPKDKTYLLFMLQNYLRILGINYDFSLEKVIQDFFLDLPSYGILNAFRRFLFRFTISNAHFHKNLNFIEEVCRSGKDNISLIWKSLEQNASYAYAMDFYFGSNPHFLTLMSAHASKGLEFDHVILGGVQANGKERIESPFIGKLPGSFKWKEEREQKRPHKSPFYLLERMIWERKTFSENKRLFYVACTRAKKSLRWVEFIDPEVQGSCPKNSWIVSLKEFLRHYLASYNYGEGEIILRAASIILPKKNLDFTSEGPHYLAPLFHRESVGLIAKQDILERQDPTSSLLFLPELSATRLVSVLDCSKKFYLQNVLKMEDELKGVLSLIGEEKLAEIKLPQFSYSPLFGDEEELENENKVVSSEERGSRVHHLLAQIIGNNLYWPPYLNHEETTDRECLQWIYPHLLEYSKSHTFVSEQSFKFAFFGYMISSIPDLILFPLPQFSETGFVEIWDFKTGGREKGSEEKYWFQLLIYAFGLYTLEKISKEDSLKLSLVYLDQKHTYSQILNYKEVISKALQFWSLLKFPQRENLHHCPACSYRPICQGQN